MGINIDLRTLLLKECKTIKSLVEFASERSGNYIDPDSISQKLTVER